jgi:hypothetical protein
LSQHGYVLWKRRREVDDRGMVIGWKLDRAQRDELLARFRPRYAKAVADHVTLKANVPSSARLPGEVTARIVGHADDGEGVEAMVVDIGGSTDRPGGGTYHITWSLADGRKARESNDVIAARGWRRFDAAIDVKLEPASFG